MRAWSFLTLDESERQFAGNLGYEDVLGVRYVWDSTVAHHRSVQPGDLAVLRGKSSVLGLGWIDEITTKPGGKVRRRCPSCRSTAFKLRRRLQPVFKCAVTECAAEFDFPEQEEIEVTFYVADYSRTWRPLADVFLVSALNFAYLTQAAQHSIRELSLEGVRKALADPADMGNLWWAEEGGMRVIQGGHRPILGRARVGQAQFRQELLRRFGAVCAFTGSQPPEVLEAAHLYRYSEEPEHDVRGGLLLRRDLHALFDRQLIGVDTADWIIRVAPWLHCYPELAMLDGQILKVSSAKRPDASYLKTHFELALDSWSARQR
ncbi:HNH endonuclease signature motif containing protein [Nonomuraea sp. NPDC050691]|uniref:HNH endonuclease n=1 Tax=Nonomuraea sp. NPDC050691 TaxID=3155661 RepID=UPI0034089468